MRRLALLAAILIADVATGQPSGCGGVSQAERLTSAEIERAAARDRRLRVVVSRADLQVRVFRGKDSLLTVAAGVASNTTLVFDKRCWHFAIPAGRRVVEAKRRQPVWHPPDWHYAEVALERGLSLRELTPRSSIRLPDGRRLVVVGLRVGVRDSAGFLSLLPLDEEIVFDSTLFVPPVGSAHRAIEGELGRFALDIGDGFLIHGTRDETSIGKRVTHGCIRLHDADIEWLFLNIPIGTPVYII